MDVLTNGLSQLLLPVFMLMILCAIAGGKPESIANAFIGILGSIVSGIFSVLVTILDGVFSPSRRNGGTKKRYSNTYRRGNPNSYR